MWFTPPKKLLYRWELQILTEVWRCKLGFTPAVAGVPSPTSLTGIGLQVLWRDHHHKADGTLVAKHLIGPAPNGAHALHSSNAVIGYEHLPCDTRKSVSKQVKMYW